MMTSAVLATSKIKSKGCAASVSVVDGDGDGDGDDDDDDDDDDDTVAIADVMQLLSQVVFCAVCTAAHMRAQHKPVGSCGRSFKHHTAFAHDNNPV